MDSASRDLRAMVERLMLGVETRKRGEQGRVDVKNAHRKFADEIAAQYAHITGQADQVDVMGTQPLDKLAVVDFAVQSFRRK